MCQYFQNHRKREVCTFYFQSICRSGGWKHCKHLHQYDPSRMSVCRFYLNQGCTNPGCLFLHIKDDVMDARQQRELAGQSCEMYARGFCRFGAKCSRNHDVRPALCPDYLAGFCIKGPRCSFGHPKMNMGLKRSRR